LHVLATLEPQGGERIIAFLSSSAVRGVLGIIFMLALFSAFRTPGMGYPEAVAVASLALMVGVPLLTGYAQWYEILAIVLGIIFLAVELFVLPGFGVAGITGICLVLAGLVMTYVPAEPIEIPGGILPTLPATKAALKEGFIVVVGGMACALLLSLWLQRYLPKLPYVNRLILTTTSGNVSVADSDVPGAVEVVAWPVVGAVGQAVTDLKPGGTGEFQDDAIGDLRTTDVVTDGSYVPRGSKIIIREVKGARVVVRAV
jgi:membrane-bound serine protease (ClpP class)